MKHCSKLLALPLIALGMSACTSTPSDTPSGFTGPSELALFGDGYPNPGDPCRRAGESAVTSPYLDDASILVACPPSSDAGLVGYQLGGREVARYQGWILFSVPQR